MAAAIDWPGHPRHWPTYMRPVIDEYGGDLVYRIGLGVLGFPPTWNPSRRQVAAIVEDVTMRFGVSELSDFAGPGKCHVEVTDFEEYGEPKSGAHVASLEILASDNPDNIGKIYKDFIPDPGRTPKSVFRLVAFLTGCGAVEKQTIRQAQKDGVELDLNPQECVGRQCFVELAEEEYNGRVNTKVKGGRSYFRLEDPMCSDWPKHEAMAKRAKSDNPAEMISASDDSPF